MKIEFLQETDSTNTYIKRYLGCGEDVIVCAVRQTGGKGTKGRSFDSSAGGVYLSKLTFYRDFSASDAFRVMIGAAVSVCKTARAFGADAHIKWPNDVYVKERKLSGTLIENAVAEGKLLSSIVGIGINVNNDVSALGGIAVSLSELAGKPLSVQSVRDRLISELLQTHSFEEYCSYVRFLGNTVTVVEGERSFRAVALRIAQDGRLVVNEGDTERALSSAEISLKL